MVRYISIKKIKIKKFKSRKAQVWGFDVMIAVTIFLVGIVVAYIYAINFLNETQEVLDSMFYEGNLISSLILSEGSPQNWTQATVEIPGILTGKKINQTKLDNFYFLAENYSNLKKLLGANYEFYFNFTEMEITDKGIISGIGKSPQEQKNLVKIERITIYKNKLSKFALLIWN